MSNDRYCLNCRSCIRSWSAEDQVQALEFSRCAAVTKIDPVTGKERHPLCRDERAWGTACGADGRLFLSRHPTVHEQLTRSLEVTPPKPVLVGAIH